MNLLVGVVAGLLVGLGAWLLGDDAGTRLRGLLSAARTASAPATEGRGAGGRGTDGRGAGGREGAGPRERQSARSAGGAADGLAFDLELVAICLQSGLPTERALSLAAAAGADSGGLDRLGRSLALGEVDEADEELAAVRRLVLFSRSTGVALAPLLQGLAGDLRRSEHRRRQIAAARLGVELVIPLGACILPAFILLGVVPVILSLVEDMGILFQ